MEETKYAVCLRNAYYVSGRHTDTDDIQKARHFVTYAAAEIVAYQCDGSVVEVP